MKVKLLILVRAEKLQDFNFFLYNKVEFVCKFVIINHTKNYVSRSNCKTDESRINHGRI
jgi:hypothetical protein